MLSVIIPAFNEEKTLAQVIDRVTALPLRPRSAVVDLVGTTTQLVVSTLNANSSGIDIRGTNGGTGNTLPLTNSWFPLARGSVYVYDGQKDGKQARDVMTVTRKTRTITGIRAAAVAHRLHLG